MKGTEITMLRSINTIRVFCLIAIVAASSRPGFGQNEEPVEGPVDRIVLKSGAILQGRILEEKKEAGRNILVVKTKSGGTISLDRAKLVEKVRSYDPLDAEYERKLATAENNAQAYWEILQWCEEQPSGKSRFRNERQFLLEKILQIDPQNKDARRKLGYRLENGQWVLENAWFEEYGYKKKDGRTWQSAMVSNFANNRAGNEDQKKQKNAELEAWFRRFEKAKTTSEEARIELVNMADELVVALLLQKLMDAQKANKELPLRRIYIDAFSRIPNRDSIKALSYLAIEDNDPGIRDKALTVLLQPGFNREMAASFMSGHLFADDDELRNRAANAVGELGVINHFMSLVNALETTRKVVVNPDAARTNVTAGPGGVGMQTPSTPQVRNVTIRSQAALGALKRLSSADFGYNKEAWQEWYIRNHTLYDTQVRTDE
jgi:hypothetical protein